MVGVYYYGVSKQIITFFSQRNLLPALNRRSTQIILIATNEKR